MLFGRVTFLPTLAYNMLMEKVSARQWYNRIDEHVVLGALPWKRISNLLVDQENVRGVVSMNEDYELFFAVADRHHWESQRVRFLQLSTPDIFHAPTVEQLKKGVQFMNEITNDGHSVYVHCKAGRTRSATLVACYLVQKYNLTPAEAQMLMEQKRPHILLRSPQHDAINRFYKQMKNS